MSEREIVCEDLSLALDDLRRDGFRLDIIYPADDPHSAILSRRVKRYGSRLGRTPNVLRGSCRRSSRDLS